MSPDALAVKQRLAAYAASMGFERFGVTSAAALPDREKHLRAWLDRGCAGEMDYMKRDPERRARPHDHLPTAKSVIALAMNYYLPDSDRPTEDGKIARYAQGRDYHTIIGKRLQAFVRYLEVVEPGSQNRSFVDSGPLLERAFAQQAGLGFIGKNSMLITKGLGSWVFLAAIVSSIELPEDQPDARSCGDCRLCIEACPTEAITDGFTIDARRCLSYLTIEKTSSVEESLRGQNSGWLFGCDICQEVCPHNARAQATQEPAYQRSIASEMGLTEILSLKNETEFRSYFHGTPLMRSGFEGLLRNACLVAASLNRVDLLRKIENLAQTTESVVVREHALWAIGRLRASKDAIAAAKDPDLTVL